MKLFDFLKEFFKKNSSIYNNLNNYKRSKYFFMVNRFLSMQYPDIVNEFNHLNINTGQAINSYHDMFSKMNKIPSWIWQGVKKTKKNKNNKKELSINISDEIINKYLNIYEINEKELNRLKKLYPQELQQELNEFSESFINTIK